MIATEIEWRTKRLQQEMSDGVYSDGTGNSSKDFLGLQAAVGDTSTITTYAGLSRATYPTWASTVTAQSGSLSLANLASDFDAIMTYGSIPTLGITTLAVFSIYEALLTPTVSHMFTQSDFRMTSDGMVRVGGTVAANQGFRALTFRGVPVAGDPRCTTGNFYFLDENHLSFYTIPQPEREMRNGFAWTGLTQRIKEFLKIFFLAPSFA